MKSTAQPPDHVLLDYATGSAVGAIALIVASHLEFCAASRRTVRMLEAVGGALLEDIEPAALAADSRARLLQRLDQVTDDDGSPHTDVSDVAWPRPLSGFMQQHNVKLSWRTHEGMFSEAMLPSFWPGYRLSLVHAGKGGYVPDHVHEGEEHLLILKGQVSVGDQKFQAGDYAYAEPGQSHEPKVEADEDCYCFLVLDGSLKFQGTHGATFDPIFRVDR